MTTISEAFNWLEELSYNYYWFADPTRHRNILHELGFLEVGWTRTEPNKAYDYLEAMIEHANDLITACQHLRIIVAEEINASNEKNHV